MLGRTLTAMLRDEQDPADARAGNANDVPIRLTRDEAVVLFELLHRLENNDEALPGLEHHAEQVALWNFVVPA
jgi:hypothetical protein